ncbi:acetyl-CoA acetyltransferase [Sphaerochaeta sp. PS]|uniref:acetyl-CoA acetyltransferase n=1 Tax=Sphaerochaeta sp. PS TaxID=3076336 RepID=UPI0028A47452|nr:acetyl-CoA acetyltransferase [Sphaerochaeta sp. PS]MDT4762154.1 acetyl-CoA acetyltransferase [Sphaerochaeta sp. PS]
MEQVFVLGGEQSDFERNFTKEKKNLVSLLRETLEDSFKATSLDYSTIAELGKADRVGVFVGNFDGEHYLNQGHFGAFLTEVSPVFNGIPSARYEAACASSAIAIDAAMTKIQVGALDLAVVVGAELMKTVNSSVCGDFLGSAAYQAKEAAGISFPFPKLFGRLADVYLERYALDEKRYLDCLAEISNKNYSNAKHNPLAQTRKWFMSLEQAKQRGTSTNSLVGGRLAISDCSQVTDGAVVVFLASEKFAREYATKRNLKLDAIPRILGWGHRVAPLRFEAKVEEGKATPYVLPWTRQAVLDAYARANLSVADIDVFETHDCFTSSEYAAISAFGITDPGKEYQAIEQGLVHRQGSHPINPSGGLIGVGHPVGASGARMFLDLWKQVSNNAEGYQIDGAKTGMMLNIGGSATTSCTFVVGR